MAVTEIRFVVEQAGCASCAALVEVALAPLAQVHGIEVDEAADSAAVRMAFSAKLSVDAVDRALAGASLGTDHSYYVKPGSWNTTP